MKPYVLTVLAAALALALGAPSRAQERPGVVYSHNAQANALFLKARDYLGTSDPRVGGKLENARAAIRLYEQAVNADPRFALAYVDMARA
jgi:hypothetical protein